MKIHVRDGDIHLTELRTRMPFQYGIATMTHSPHAFVRLRVEVEDRLATGVSADSLPPKWFTKDPARPVAEEIDEMVGVIVHALRTAPGLDCAASTDLRSSGTPGMPVGLHEKTIRITSLV